MMITVDIAGILPFADKNDIESVWLPKALEARSALINGSCPGREFSGWLKLPEYALNGDVSRIKETADEIRSNSEILLVVGIGGSYLGARAVKELLKPEVFGKSTGTELIFAGNGLSGAAVRRTIGSLEGRDFSICVISKSGTTTEPAVAFRILNAELEKRYGAKSAERVYAVTDAEKGALHDMAKQKGYKTFVIPSDIGGRYSVLTPVGLLPIASAGIDINALLNGAFSAQKEMLSTDADNPALIYAAARQALYTQGKKIEVLSFMEPEYRYLGEWWKQLFGESEGKDGKGIFPVSLEYTADLHSMGQYMQEGERLMFETFLWSQPGQNGVIIPHSEKDEDKLNYIAGKSIDYVNRVALDATREAHIAGSVPCVEIKTPEMSAETLGALLYFFELSCAVSGCISGVNPFDQPGVEAYKKNMFRLLGKK